MIIKGASGTAAELEFSMTDGSGPVTSHTWATGELLLVLPGGTFGNATVANIVNKGRGLWALQLTPGETALVGKASVQLAASLGVYEGNQFFGDDIQDISAAAVAVAVGNLVVEGSTTLIQSLRGYNSALLARATFGLTSRVFRNLADTKNRIVATVSSLGRDSISLDLS